MLNSHVSTSQFSLQMNWHIILSLILLCTAVCISNCENNIEQNSIRLTDNEKSAIEKVKGLADKSLYMDYMKTNLYLIRWVRDAKSNPEKAAKNMAEFHKFRLRNNIDSILNENWNYFEHKFPFEIIDGVDIEGNPIITISIGKWDLRREVVAGKIDKIYRYADYMLEKCSVHIRQANRINATVIINMAGFSSKTHLCSHCALLYPYMGNAFENHYPLSTKYLYMINTPNYFRPAVEGIRSFLSTNTLKGLKIFDFDKSQWGPVILKTIPSHILTPEFGGSKTI